MSSGRANRVWVIGAVVVALIAFVYAFAAAPQTASAADGKNLKVLPKSMTKKQIKAVMKKISKATDKGCDDCHDMDDFAKDGEMKIKARDMFKLTNAINAKMKKDGFKVKVSCMTCHQGKAVPKK